MLRAPFQMILAFAALMVACSPQPSQEFASSAPLSCSYSQSFFRVSDGIDQYEKYIGNWDQQEAKIECGDQVAAALIGSYFVFFSKGQIKEKYIGSFPEERRLISLNGNTASAVMGAYFITAKAGGEIASQHVGSTSVTPLISISSGTTVAVIGPYFVVSDGNSIQEKFVGAGASALLAVGEVGEVGEVGAGAILGQYFIGYLKGEIFEKFMGSRSDRDMIVKSEQMIAASVGQYFVVLDPIRKQIQQRAVGGPGVVSIVGGIAIHERENGRQIRYDLALGTFN